MSHRTSEEELAKQSEASFRLQEMQARQRDQVRSAIQDDMPRLDPIGFEHGWSPAPTDLSTGRSGSWSASPAVPRGEAGRPPLIARPVSVTYSRSASRPSLLRARAGIDEPGATFDSAEYRLERLQIFSQRPDAFAAEAAWFAQRRSALSEAILASVEKTIQEFVLRGESPEAVRALPKVLTWYGRPNLASLAKLILRAVELDDPRSPLPRRQILIGTFQRYRMLDEEWRDPAAGDVLRALTQSKTVESHLVPSIEALHPPFAAPVEEFLIDYSFAAATESMYAQRKALLHPPTCDRLLDAAIARLESTEEAERESAYVILTAAEPTPERADAVLTAIRCAFANESVPPSPAAHAALSRWIDREHADGFREFCDCECPVRRYAARAVVNRYALDELDAAAIASAARE
ncbi:MAG TPA: hypothetical protein VGN57_05480 [Pirellulaceae bacterium]|jgi:hypothetical protein|nr:hypothetical protein [Pirellulaceae bacterium]